MDKIISETIDFIKKYNLQDKTIIVGFSGGYDSMCLLDILSKIKDMPDFYDMTIIAAHFNHNWRGEEAKKEQEVCRIFAQSKGIEFYTKTASCIKRTENDARILRYEFFEEAIEEFDADAVFTAHNYDDNAETVLYRIIKGTGIIGLKGIAEKRNVFYRPLLNIKRSDIVNYCSANNLCPNNDSSNMDTKYSRNYLRLNVIPAMEKINESVKDALNILSVNACNDNQIIEEYLQNLRPIIFENSSIISKEYKKLSKPVKLRILYEYIQSLNLDYDYKKIQEIYEFIENNITQRNGSTISLASALWLYADEKIIETIPHKDKNHSITEEITIDENGEYIIGEYKFSIKPFKENEIFVFPNSTSNFAYTNFKNVPFPLTLRTRKDGDVITPFGMNGTMKLKKYLNSKGIPRHNRDKIYMLCSNSEVLWVIGVGLNNKISVIDKPTHVLEWSKI